MTINESEKDPLLVLRDIAEVMETVQIPYCLGGSFASGVRGEWRQTNDIDIVCLIAAEQVSALVASASQKFFVDEISARSAINAGISFNLIHIEACPKVDLFTKRDPFQESQLARATKESFPSIEEGIPVATAEDVILAKLRWYQMGGEQSERQWRDIKTVMSLNQATLDGDYLQRWAETLKIEDLLQRLKTAATLK